MKYAKAGYFAIAASVNAVAGEIAPVRPPRSGPGSGTAMKSEVVEISNKKGVLSTAFDELVAHSGCVVRDFKEAFEVRARSTELPESGGGVDGLTRSLGALLRRIPPESYLTKKYSRSASVEPAFEALFRDAIARLATTDIEALESFEQHVRRARLEPMSALRALLARYAANRRVYPY